MELSYLEGCLLLTLLQIIVTQSGCPVTMPLGERYADPYLCLVWRSGNSSGITDMLFGCHNPTSRLSVTFPVVWRTRQPSLAIARGSRRYTIARASSSATGTTRSSRKRSALLLRLQTVVHDIRVLGLKVPERIKLGGQGEQSFEVSVDVANTGDRDGHEIVEVYISDMEYTALRPHKELKGFAKVWVAKGQTATAKFSLDSMPYRTGTRRRRSGTPKEGLLR